MLWDDFINSEWHDWRGRGRSEDRLDKPSWLKEWMEKHQLSAPRLPDTQELAALKGFRAFLHRIVEDIVAGSELAPTDLDEINRVMAKGPVTRKIVQSGQNLHLEYFAVRSDWEQLMAEIAGSFAHTLSEGEISRFRICDNKDCLWVYYDDTRNRSKRYCEDKSCGNLMKVRRFRARKKEESAK